MEKNINDLQIKLQELIKEQQEVEKIRIQYEETARVLIKRVSYLQGQIDLLQNFFGKPDEKKNVTPVSDKKKEN